MTDKKPWYQVRGVDYSSDLSFFMQHQVVVIGEQAGTRFISRLECYTFLHKPNVRDITHDITQLICKQIHDELLSGRHGAGHYTE